MTQHKQKQGAVQVILHPTRERHTRYAGVLALYRLWAQLELASLPTECGIHYGQGEDMASAMLFALTIGPLVEADSVRKVAQRFGGESSPRQMQVDSLLRQLVPQGFSQRMLSRFVNCERHEWLVMQRACVRRLQQQPRTRIQRGGVLVLDDLPLPKPYATEMDYLEELWDSNQNRQVKGYVGVHLYYHHPDRPSYSLVLEPWRKTSRWGETRPKPPHAHRRARADEERSKLDLALDHIEQVADHLPVKVPLLFDGWYFARWFVAALTQLGFSWISQAGSQRKFDVEGMGYVKVPTLIDQGRRCLRPLLLDHRVVQAWAVSATLRHDKYTRHDQPVQLVLVQGLFAGDEPDAVRVLVCNQPQWSIPHILTFHARSQIEHAHRTGKQLAAWTSFHSRSWASHQAHWVCALLRSLLLTLLACAHPRATHYSLAQWIDCGIRASARLELSADRQLTLYLPRGQPLLDLCCDIYAFVKVPSPSWGV